MARVKKANNFSLVKIVRNVRRGYIQIPKVNWTTIVKIFGVVISQD